MEGVLILIPEVIPTARAAFEGVALHLRRVWQAARQLGPRHALANGVEVLEVVPALENVLVALQNRGGLVHRIRETLAVFVHGVENDGRTGFRLDVKMKSNEVRGAALRHVSEIDEHGAHSIPLVPVPQRAILVRPVGCVPGVACNLPTPPVRGPQAGGRFHACAEIAEERTVAIHEGRRETPGEVWRGAL